MRHVQSIDLILLTTNLWHHIWFEILLHKNERVTTSEMPFIILDFAIDPFQGVWLTGDLINNCLNVGELELDKWCVLTSFHGWNKKSRTLIFIHVHFERGRVVWFTCCLNWCATAICHETLKSDKMLNLRQNWDFVSYQINLLFLVCRQVVGFLFASQ